MLIAPRVSEPMESDVPCTFQSPTEPGMGEAAAAHEHHHPAMTNYNTTVKTSSSSRPKSPVYIHRCPFQNCTHGRFIQPAAARSEVQDCEEYYKHQEPSTYTSISDEDLLAACHGYEREDHHRKMYAYSDPGCDRSPSPCEAAECPADQWYTRDDSYITTQDTYTHRYSADGHRRLVSRGPILHQYTHIPGAQQPSVAETPRTRSSTVPRIPKVSMGYRQRAIDCMLRQLRVSNDSSDPSTIQVIMQRVEQLEDQLYHHAQTKDEYQLLVASKLYAILQQLAERQQRSSSPVRYQGSAPSLRT